MNHVSSNALLKSLEEPAGDTRFILATEDSAALLPTIRSRCQSFVLTSPPTLDAAAWLQTQNANINSKDALVWLKAAGGQPETALTLAEALVKTSAWSDFPKKIVKGAAPSDLPAALVETPQALVGALQKLCHDALCVSQGAEPRFFNGADIAAPVSAVKKLTAWAKALNVQVRSAEHTLNAGLMIEALLSEAKESLMVR
jgi:DNA polymerase-3 subunit delta'